MTAYKVIGKRINRVDGIERVTGKAAFAADLHLSGMLTCRILRSPHAHAIYNATGVRLHELPMHPGRVLMALLEQNGGLPDNL